LTLPAVSAITSVFEVNNIGSGSIIIQAAAGQTILFAGGVTPVAGNLTSTTTGQSIALECCTANTVFQAQPSGVFLNS
jgi:hypothetical protein